MKLVHTCSLVILLFLIGCTPDVIHGDNMAEQETQVQITRVVVSLAEEVEVTPVPHIQPKQVDVQIVESDPLYIKAVITGLISHDCVTIGSITQSRYRDDITIVLEDVQDPEATCTITDTPFEEHIDLDLDRLTVGTYTVWLGTTFMGKFGIADTFTLDESNAPLKDPLEICDFADPSQPSFVDLDLGYCFQYPLKFLADNFDAEGFESVWLADIESKTQAVFFMEEDVMLTLKWEPTDLSTAEFAQDVLNNWKDGADSFENQTERLIDGEPLIVVEGVPDNFYRRIGFVVKNGMGYQFELTPNNLDDAKTARSDEVWQSVIDSFDFVD